MRYLIRHAYIATLITLASPAFATGNGLVDWQSWSDDVFERAVRENKFVLLDLEAVWCHWCHVMDQQTYADPDVAELISKYYLPVKVDQDSRPDLSNRYEFYGWPATIVFAPDGTEIVKRAGYIPPERFKKLLQVIVDDPSPENDALSAPIESYTTEGILSAEFQQMLERRHIDEYDTDLGGRNIFQKFLIPDSVEYALVQAARGDELQEQRVHQTLDAALKLLDPVWGGFYQYSTHRDWDHPHFEKIMSTQSGYLRAYALAYSQWREPRYLQAAQAVVRYLDIFLTSPEGAFYTSQDADVHRGEHSGEFFALDDEGRRALGIPQVDKHLYARENGWMIESLAILYEATLDQSYLDRAVRATRWIEANRNLPDGGFRHDEHNMAGPYLGDTLAMARAYLHLYRVTADRTWLERVHISLRFIVKHFTQDEAGLISATSDGSPITPRPQVDENIDFVRFGNLLQHYTGDTSLRPVIDLAMRFLATPEVVGHRISFEGVLLADAELRRDPLHLTIIGAKTDPVARALFDSALATHGWYKRIDWWDVSEGALPNPDVQYPVLDRAAAFVCTEKRCSLPVFKPEDLAGRIAAIVSVEGEPGT